MADSSGASIMTADMRAGDDMAPGRNWPRWRSTWRERMLTANSWFFASLTSWPPRKRTSFAVRIIETDPPELARILDGSRRSAHKAVEDSRPSERGQRRGTIESIEAA